MYVSQKLRLSILGGMSFFFNNHILSIVLPLYIYSIGGSAVEVGLMAGLMSLLSTITRPSIGRLLDSRGRRKPILLATVLLGLISLFYIWSGSILSVIMLRALQGACFAVVNSGYFTLISDLDLDTDRSKLFGYAGMAMPISLLVSPIVTEYLLGLQYGFSTLFLTASFVAAVGFVLFCLVIGDTESMASIVTDSLSPIESDPVTPHEPQRTRRKTSNMIGAFYLGAADTAVLSFIPIYFTHLGLPYSAFLSTFALGMILLQFSVGKLIDVVGLDRINLVGHFALGVSLILAGTCTGMFGLIAAALAFSVGFGCVETSLNVLALSSNFVARGKAIGNLQFFVNAGRTIGSFVLGYVAHGLGHSSMFVVVGLSATIPIGLKWFETRRLRRQSCKK